jgi:hypothetical protein
LYADPGSGYEFVEWGDYLEGVTDNPTEVVMTEPMTISAVFKEKAKVSPWLWAVIGVSVATGAVTFTYLNKRHRRKPH